MAMLYRPVRSLSGALMILTSLALAEAEEVVCEVLLLGDEPLALGRAKVGHGAAGYVR